MGQYLWQDRCESLPNGWVWGANDVTLSAVDPQEGTYCFKIDYAGWGVTTRADKTISPTISLPNPFDIYFWFKGVAIPSFEFLEFMLGTWSVGIRMDVTGANVKINMRNKSVTGVTSYYVTKDEWHLFRLNVEQDGVVVRVKLYIDDLYKGLMNQTWTFGNLSAAYFQDETGQYEVYLDWLRIPNPDYTEDVVIDNEPYDCIRWREQQRCKVAVRDIPLRTTGSFVDTGTYTLQNRRLYMSIRLTEAQKTTLQTTFDGRVKITIIAQGWTYTGWLRRKPLGYEYSRSRTAIVREWLVRVEFDVEEFSYSP